MREKNEILEEWAAFAKGHAQTGRGMFSPRVSLWHEVGSDDFLKRKLPVPDATPREFSCHIKGLDTHRVSVYNGFVSGAPGKNLLYPEKDAGPGELPCVCRSADLARDPSFQAKWKAVFGQPGQEQEKDLSVVRTTADFAKGNREAGAGRAARLNRDLPQDTLVVYLPAGCRLEKPLQIVNLCHGNEALFVQPHCQIWLEKGAVLSLVHCTDSHPQSDILANALVEIRMEAGARLEYTQMQNVGDYCRIFNHIRADLKSEARLMLHQITLNGGVTQNDTEISLLEPAAAADVSGLYLQDKTQKVDNQVRINHFAPDTHSRELFKGVMDDSAEAYFKGHVFVNAQAQHTEAYQTCRNLLVSPKAQAYAKPYLEIYADDVQCNHGVTVGQLDEDALFYMRCRGIPAEAARRLLMRAYADEILRQITVEELRLWLTSLVKQRFSGQLQACQDCMLACTGGSCA